MMTSKNNITINIQTTFKDFLHANRLYRASKASRNYNDQVLVGVIAVVAFGSYLLFLVIRPELFPNVSPWGKFFAVVLFLMGWALIFDLRPTIGLWLRYRENRQLYLEPHQVVFDEVGVTIQSQNASSKYDWRFYQEVVEGRGEFILIYGDGLYFGIPKASFQSEGVIDVFRNMLKSNVPTFKQKPKLLLDFRGKNAA